MLPADKKEAPYPDAPKVKYTSPVTGIFISAYHFLTAGNCNYPLIISISLPNPTLMIWEAAWVLFPSNSGDTMKSTASLIS